VWNAESDKRDLIDKFRDWAAAKFAKTYSLDQRK